MAKTSHLQETGTGNAMMTSLRVNSTQAWAYCMLHVTVSVACKNSVCILIVYGGYGRDKRLKLPYVSRQAGYFLMGPYSPSAVNEVDSSWCITWACNHWFPSVYIYKWGGRCSNVNVSALHKCYVVKKICPLSISLSQTWAPVSVRSGYTYHCNCRERTGPLTLTPCSQPYLDTAVAPACHFTPNAIHSFPNTQIKTACSFGVFALIIFPQPTPAPPPSEASL